MTTEITVKQAPIIVHDLYEVGKSVTQRIEELNLENQVVTEETIQAIKAMRADLNKEAKEWEAQRKTVKDAVMTPYNEFEEVYKSEVIEKFKAADALLKDKITEFENKLKDDRKEEIKQYFVELVLSEGIDFLDFKQLGIDIKLSDSIKSYKDRINAFVGKVKDELVLIDTQAHKAEILVEYKKTLNAAKAIKEISDRKEAERIERERLQMAETNRRKAQLHAINFVYHDITRTMNWIHDEAVHVKFSDVENMTKEEWSVKLAELQEMVKPAHVAPEPEVLRPPVAEYKTTSPAPTPVQEETFTASFEVTGTMTQLKALGEYMRANNITYKNI